MQDAFVHCEQLVRTADKDRYLATLFAPAAHRSALYALYAFNAEVARVRDIAREPLPGEIRLQWWSDVLRGERAGEAAANPVAGALLQTIERHDLSAAALGDLVEARTFDLYDDPMATLADLEAYAFRTSSAVIAMAARILGASADDIARPAGIAFAYSGMLRNFPLHAARRQLYVPLEVLARHGVSAEDVFARTAKPGLRAALAELRGHARAQLEAAGKLIPAVPAALFPALLPVSVARLQLDRMEYPNFDPYAPPEVPQWRRQWRMWRAAQNAARIAG
jgi:phytoene synthase